MNRFILIPVLLVGVLTALTYDDYDLEIGVLSVSIFLLFFIFFHLDKFKKKQEEAKAKELAEVIKRRHKKEEARAKKEKARVKQEKARVKKEEARTKKEEEREKIEIEKKYGSEMLKLFD